MKFIPNKAKQKNKQGEHRKTSSFKELIKISLPYKNKFLLAIACVILINTSVLLKPIIVKLVIDDFLVGKKAQSGFYSITAMGIAYLLVSLTVSLLSYTQANLVNSAGQKIIKNLRRRVFSTIQFLPLSYLDKTSSGRLITRATNDISEISDMYTDIVINLFKDIVLLVGIVYTMLSINVQLSLISFTVIPFMALLVVFIKNKIRENFFTLKHIIGKINGSMAENISGMKVIQIFRAEKEKEQEFKELNHDYYKSTIIQIRLNSILRPASDVFQNIAIAILIWFGMGKISDHSLQIGVLYAFTTYVKQFFNPISDLSEKYNSIQSALVSTERIFNLLKQKDITEDVETGLPLQKIEKDIEFKNVWFSYNDKDWVLKDVSFKVSRGQSAAFVGETGAGKTTIISLITGFYKIQKGEILIDGININDIKLKDLRKNISVVLQDVFLFSGDIKSNITLGDPIDDKTISEAIKNSCFDTVISDFQKGIDESVMERGSTFSAGQRQLLSFARAIAHDPDIFILDEATANIDTHTENLIQQALENTTKNRITLVIAHRLSTIKNCDKIVVMRYGEIVEMGNHQELLDREGYYANLVRDSSCFDKVS
ncbi:putative ABC transporter ATP-binding protein [Ruminiclostridium hungatei]|uniref:Putative ABC transporter ATP-binding protein n=1 Tax=Ruminiclostridium hungatei TaxID=48256 RepID=A0A1V4SND5_RUMHU|nr:ABC transporter ATP-binding protein [Ruminiclostridium hungatei]OPX44986.1 putative ABC transporter ATP-binding protein [Ruminiclostridium hungatei]